MFSGIFKSVRQEVLLINDTQCVTQSPTRGPVSIWLENDLKDNESIGITLVLHHVISRKII